MTMPHIARSCSSIERKKLAAAAAISISTRPLQQQSCNVSRPGDDGILPPNLVGCRSSRLLRETAPGIRKRQMEGARLAFFPHFHPHPHPHRRLRQALVEGLLVQEAELHEMDVHGVRIRREVYKLPHFCRAQHRLLRDRIAPRVVGEQRMGGRVVFVVELHHEIGSPVRLLQEALDGNGLHQRRRGFFIFFCLSSSQLCRDASSLGFRVLPLPRRVFDDEELHHILCPWWAESRIAARERSRTGIEQQDLMSATTQQCKIDQEVDAFGGSNGELGEHLRAVEETTVSTDLHERQSLVAQGELEETRVGCIHHTQTVHARLHADVRPSFPVHENSISEVLWTPARVHLRRVPDGREVDAAVREELHVVQQQHQFLLFLGKHPRIACSRASVLLQLCFRGGRSILVLILPDDVRAEQAREHIQPHDSQAVIMVPEHRRRLRVRVSVVLCAVRGSMKSYSSSSCRSEPCIWVPIWGALDFTAMQVRDDRHSSSGIVVVVAAGLGIRPHQSFVDPEHVLSVVDVILEADVRLYSSSSFQSRSWVARCIAACAECVQRSGW